MDMLSARVTNDRNQQRFQLSTESGLAFIDYTLEQGLYQLLHSEVPNALRGKGIGKVLVEQTFDLIAKEGRQAIAHCGFIKSVARSSDKWRDIIKH